ncbi:MAG: DUF2191 domain-containing protein [Candidatus Rokubacteria bacterium]|nr:DUF2191 domain-containing protein [Candidatus Rokubacteria bacterium]
MRTTLTLDDDVAALLEREQTRTKKPLKQIVNEALRVGLTRRKAPGRPGEPYRTEAVSLGRCLVPSLDNIAEVLAISEGEAYR